MKQVEVTIMGQGYVLGCPEGGEAILAEAVNSVDREMTTIRDSGRVKARERMAVLAALNLAYALADKKSPNVTNSPSDDIQIEALIRRLDQAMGSEEHST